MNRSNTGRCFLDANVWLYAFIESQDRKKSGIAKQIIQNKETFVSGQVINEVSINLIRKARFDEARIRRLIISFYRKLPRRRKRSRTPAESVCVTFQLWVLVLGQHDRRKFLSCRSDNFVYRGYA